MANRPEPEGNPTFTLQSNGQFASPTTVPGMKGQAVSVLNNENNSVTLYFWHRKEGGSWHKSSSLFTNGTSSDSLPGNNKKKSLGTISPQAFGTYALTTANSPPGDGMDGATGEINITNNPDED